MTLGLPYNHTCFGCIWCDQCFQYNERYADDVCVDFLPTDEDDDCFSISDEESIDITYYENDLKMRAAAYQEMIEEYSDGNW